MVPGSQDAQHQRNDAEPNNEAAGVTGSGWTVAPRGRAGPPAGDEGQSGPGPQLSLWKVPPVHPSPVAPNFMRLSRRRAS